MKAAVLIAALAVCLASCYTPRHIDNLRSQRARDVALKLSANQGTVYAGVDILGVKEALQADPGGTSAALGKDAILAALAGLATAYVADQASGGGDSKGRAPDVPQIQADTVIYNSGNGSINYTPVGGSTY